MLLTSAPLSCAHEATTKAVLQSIDQSMKMETTIISADLLILQRRVEMDSPMMIPESAMASFCRAQRLAPIKLGRESIMQMPMRPKESYFGNTAGNRMQSAFASQKDIPLPQWGPRPMGIDCPLSPDFSGRRCASSCMALNDETHTIQEPSL